LDTFQAHVKSSHCYGIVAWRFHGKNMDFFNPQECMIISPHYE